MNILQSVLGKKLKFTKKQQETKDVYTFYFEKTGISYKAGQHFLIVLPHKNTDKKGFMRPMSISSIPEEKYFAFTTRCPDEQVSSFKKALVNLGEGDTIRAIGPSPIQDVFRVKDFNKTYIYLVGGTGITPARAVLKDAALNNKNLSGKLFYCNKDQNFVFGDEINQAVDNLPTFEQERIVSPDRVSVKKLQEDYKKFGKDTIFVISGSEGFTKNYLEIIKQNLDINEKQIKAYTFKGLK